MEALALFTRHPFEFHATIQMVLINLVEAKGHPHSQYAKDAAYGPNVNLSVDPYIPSLFVWIGLG